MRSVRAFLSFKCRLNRAEYAIVFVGYLLLPTMFFLTESSTHANGYRIRKVTKVTLEELSKILDAVNAGLCRLFVSSMQLNTAPNPIPGLFAADELVGGFFGGYPEVPDSSRAVYSGALPVEKRQN